MKLKHVIPLLAVVSLLTMAVIVWGYLSWLNFDSWEYDMHLRVGNYTGLNVDSDKLWFGTVTPGNGASRPMNITSPHDKPLKGIVSFSGDIAPYAGASKPVFIINPGETKTLLISATSMPDTPMGNYTGRIKIMFHRISM